MLLLLFLSAHAFAQDKPSIVLRLDPQNGDDYSYRKDNTTKTINVMLYGFKNSEADDAATSLIPKDRKSLNAFFHQHWARVQQDYLGGNNATVKFVAGDDSITAPVNRGAGIEPAKMAGFTIPNGRFTLGGGYSWGEKNPAYMLRTADGFMVGASYDAGNAGYQISYLTSGENIAGFRVGGSSVPYKSVLFGTSFRVTQRMGLTATAQYRTDEDPLTNGTSQAVFTVGTRWKF